MYLVHIYLELFILSVIEVTNFQNLEYATVDNSLNQFDKDEADTVIFNLGTPITHAAVYLLTGPTCID